MQPDPLFYERMFAEIGNVFIVEPNCLRVSDRSRFIRAVLLNNPQLKFYPNYLDELGEIEQLPIGLGLMVLLRSY